MSDTLERLRPILADLFLREEERITPERNLNDLTAPMTDSIEEIVFAIETEWLIKTSAGFDQRVEKCETVADLVKAIDAELSEADPASPEPAGTPSEPPTVSEQRTGLSIAAEAALVELKELHGVTHHHTCQFPEHCPAAVAIHDLEIALAEERLKQGGVIDPETTAQATGHRVQELDDRYHHTFSKPESVVLDAYKTGEVILLVRNGDNSVTVEARLFDPEFQAVAPFPIQDLPPAAARFRVLSTGAGWIVAEDKANEQVVWAVCSEEDAANEIARLLNR